MSLTESLRRFAEGTPDPVYAVLQSAFWTVHPRRQTRVAIPTGDGVWRVWTREGSYLSIRGALWRGSERDNHVKFDQYTDSEFAQVDDGDIVVDVGAFLGEFSILAVERADCVYAIEPNPRTYRCLSRRLRQFNTANALHALPSSESEDVAFHVGSDPSESSLIGVDQGTSESIKMRAQALDDILEEQGVDSVDFLKMDAEGAEPEALAGLVRTPVEKFAIDAGGERFGETTVQGVSNILEGRGYQVKVRDDIVFARR